MMLVGLGVGIDYALLIFARYRSELLGGADRATARGPRWTPRAGPSSSPGARSSSRCSGCSLLGLGALQGVGARAWRSPCWSRWWPR